MRIALFGQKKTDRNKSVRPSPYFLIWPIHPTACGGGGILGSYVKLDYRAYFDENISTEGWWFYERNDKSRCTVVFIDVGKY